MNSDPAITLQAPAKVNLWLSVTGRRNDGYHELATWMQKLALADTVVLKPRSAGIKLVCRNALLPEDEGNLAYRAAVAFFRETGLGTGISIELFKRIPVAAGLGGGSSDAAAVLKGLNALYDTGLSNEELREIGLRLGADVPFLVSPYQAAWATGVGERLQEIKSLEESTFILINPGFPVSTKWVYDKFDSMQGANFALTLDGNPFMLSGAKDSGLPETLYNDLEVVTINRYPEISELKETLLAKGASVSLMSGSGPTVFGIFKKYAAAADCLDELTKELSGRVYLTFPA